MMREIRTIYNSLVAGNSGADLENLFWTRGEYKDNDFTGIKQSEIDDYAKEIARQYNEFKSHSLGSIDLSVILDLFSEESILDLLRPRRELSNGEGNENDIDDKDQLIMQATVYRIRKAILKSLERFLDPGDFMIIERNLNNLSNTIQQVDVLGKSSGKSILKKHERLESGNAEDTEQVVEAFERFANLKVKHPNIIDVSLYNFDGHDVPAMLTKKLNLVTLKDVLSHPENFNGGITFKSLIEYLIQYIDVFIYLVENGLVLQDVPTKNVGIDLDKNKAIVFDLEGLYPLGEKRRGRLCDSFDIPPEAKKGMYGKTFEPTPVLPSEMVYQLAKDFLNPQIKLPEADGELKNRLIDLFREMYKYEANLRPSLSDIKAELQSILDKIKN